MSEPLAPGNAISAGPRFYVTPRSRFSPGSVLLAFVIASVVVLAVLHAQSRSRAGSSGGEDDDDPSRVDTIYLGDPGEAPVAARPKGQPNSVHPFVVVHLPSTGSQFGQIPDSAAGRLLFAWLAAFNERDPSAARRALPAAGDESVEAAQVELRKETGGFTLLSAKEIEPGVLVFRLHDQTADAHEVLGTLRVLPGSTPARIESFSLREVGGSPAKAP